MQFPVLKSDRLILRQIEKEDAKDLFNYLSDDNVTRYLGKGSFKRIEEAYELIDKVDNNYKQGRSIRWAICLKTNNKLIGTIGLDGIHLKNKRCDIGYDLNSIYWRQGIGSEAIKTITKYAFDKLYLIRIGAQVFPDNIASIQLLTKIGFEKEGILRKYIFQNGVAHDVIVCSLINNW